MSVYVDDMYAGYGRMKMSHMLADTHEELLAMADVIGVQRRWLQNPGEVQEHFDIAMSKKVLAIQHGAIAVTTKDIGLILRDKRAALSNKEADK